MAGDPYWNNVVLAMHMDGANNSTTFTELTGKTITPYGNAQIKTAQYKFGGSSAYFDGVGDYLSATITAIGTGDYTIDAWVYPTSVAAGYKTIFCLAGNINLTLNANTFAWYEGGLRITSPAITANSWYHVAAVRSAGVVSLYVNGVPAGATYSSALNITGTLATVGGISASEYLTGYIDDLRVTNGVARYTTNFAPPNRAFPDRLYTSLSGTVQDSYGANAERLIKSYRMSDGLLAGVAASDATTGEFTVDAEGAGKHFVVCQENYDPHYANVALDMRMDDVGLTDQKSHSVTAYASAARSSLASRFGGYSAKFNGTTDYLGVATSTDFDFGSGDFTIEAWVAIAAEKAVDSFHAIAALGWNDVAVNSYAFFFGLVNGPTGGRELRAYFTPTGVVSGLVMTSCPAGWALGEFAHVAVVRSGAMLRAYFNGVGGSPSVSPASVFAPTAQPLYIGNGHPANTVHHYLNGYIDSLRITKGVARYTQDFIPQPLPFASQTAPVENALIFDNITPV